MKKGGRESLVLQHYIIKFLFFKLYNKKYSDSDRKQSYLFKHNYRSKMKKKKIHIDQILKQW